MKAVQLNVFVTATCLALLTAACGGGSASLSPVAPSSSGAVASSFGTATISGQVNGVTAAPLTASGFQLEDSRAVTITVAGTGISTTTNGQGQFTLTNVPPGNVTLNITGGGANATVTISGIGANDQVQITVTVNGGSAHVDSEQHSHPDNGNAETVGTIASIDATAKSFKMGDVTVTTTSTTVIRHGDTTGAFPTLKVGDRVEVRGTKSGTTIAATEIKVETPDNEGGNDQGDNNQGNRPPTTPPGSSSGTAEASGTVASLAGTCPAITFTLSATKVTTTSATTFASACSAVKNGLKVEVKGTKQTDGSITATKVSIDD